jgi:hypothetical protein
MAYHSKLLQSASPVGLPRASEKILRVNAHKVLSVLYINFLWYSSAFSVEFQDNVLKRWIYNLPFPIRHS